MNKYYGLRLVRTFFIATSLIICIVTIATIGAVGGLSIINGDEFDPIRALLALVIGGVVALLSYAFGQLIDLNLKNYEVSWQLKEQIEEANRLNNKTVTLLNKQLKMMYTGFDLDQEIEMKKIEQQLKERRSNLS
ncbi:MAG: hypothetical protein WBC91_10120 [Phototrophicaceae bacterium]